VPFGLTVERIAQEPADDVLGPDAVPEARARADIAIILVPNASWLRSATNWPAKPASPRNAVGKEGF